MDIFGIHYSACYTAFPSPLIKFSPFFNFYPHPRTFFHCIFRERRREREKHQCKREHRLVASYTHPNWGPNLQPKYVPWPGIKLVTFWLWDDAPIKPYCPGLKSNVLTVEPKVLCYLAVHHLSDPHLAPLPSSCSPCLWCAFRSSCKYISATGTFLRQFLFLGKLPLVTSFAKHMNVIVPRTQKTRRWTK